MLLFLQVKFLKGSTFPVVSQLWEWQRSVLKANYSLSAVDKKM